MKSDLKKLFKKSRPCLPSIISYKRFKLQHEESLIKVIGGQFQAVNT